jgi:dUTP pyrophosphatase
MVHTGISVAIEPGYEVQVRPRSGNALKKGLTIVNTPGTIDCTYRGPVCVILANIGHQGQTIRVGDKIAQLVVCPVTLSEIVEVDELDETDRGHGGFGSTG